MKTAPSHGDRGQVVYRSLARASALASASGAPRSMIRVRSAPPSLSAFRTAACAKRRSTAASLPYPRLLRPNPIPSSVASSAPAFAAARLSEPSPRTVFRHGSGKRRVHVAVHRAEPRPLPHRDVGVLARAVTPSCGEHRAPAEHPCTRLPGELQHRRVDDRAGASQKARGRLRKGQRLHVARLMSPAGPGTRFAASPSCTRTGAWPRRGRAACTPSRPSPR